MPRTPTDLALDRLRAWAARWPAGRTVTLVDLDSPDDAFVEACNGAGPPLRAERLAVRPAEAVSALGDRAFDYAHVGDALAQRNSVERLTTLRAAERLGAHGLLWSGTLRPALNRSTVLDIRKRLALRWTHARVPRLGGPFLVAGEHADAWTGLGEPARSG